MSKIFSEGQFSGGVITSAHVTHWLTMRNRVDEIAFEKFKLSQSNSVVFIALQIFMTFYFFVTDISGITYHHTQLAIISLVIAIIVPIITGWVLIITRGWRNIFKKRIFSDDAYHSLVMLLESFYLFGVCVSFYLCVANVVLNGSCQKGDLYENLTCSISSDHQMPEDMMVISQILPVFVSLIVKGARWQIVILAYVTGIASMAFIMMYFGKTDSMHSLVLFIPISVMVMYEHQRHNVSLFLLSRSQQQLLQENERLADEVHANELRSMIGNVAHDLKTPLSAFVSGMELITTIVSELKTCASNTNSDSFRSLTAISESIVQMRSTNEFMLMTINRCIDYTKASQGLKLVPRLETINFVDAINLPLSCMKCLLDKDNKMVIKLDPISSDIAANIITDKQWLQENILCLLSNAVKYSAGGLVNISVDLVAESDVIGHVLSTLRSIKSKVTNAASSSGGNNIKIATQVLKISIEDTGIGIAEETIHHLFNPFKQAQRLAGGTGLGLYSLAKRIEALGGDYGVVQRADARQGSIFWFTIPYRPDSSVAQNENFLDIMVETPQCSTVNTIKTFDFHDQSITAECQGFSQGSESVHKPQPRVTPPTVQQSVVIPKLNILIVDDSLSILKMSSMMLRRQGHNITTAENGSEALSLMSNAAVVRNNVVDNITSTVVTSISTFDVVLMDLQMPIMDGLEATRRLRKIEMTQQRVVPFHSSLNVSNNNLATDTITRHQLIIGVSACSDNETMEAAFAAGIDEFIPKPFSLQSFNETYVKCVQQTNRDK